MTINEEATIIERLSSAKVNDQLVGEQVEWAGDYNLPHDDGMGIPRRL